MSHMPALYAWMGQTYYILSNLSSNRNGPRDFPRERRPWTHEHTKTTSTTTRQRHIIRRVRVCVCYTQSESNTTQPILSGWSGTHATAHCQLRRQVQILFRLHEDRPTNADDNTISITNEKGVDQPLNGGTYRTHCQTRHTKSADTQHRMKATTYPKGWTQRHLPAGTVMINTMK